MSIDLALAAAQMSQSYDAFITQRFSDNPPVAFASFASASSSALKFLTQGAAGVTQYATGAAYLQAVAPLANILNGISLVGNVAADVTLVAQALDSGDQARIQEASLKLIVSATAAMMVSAILIGAGAPYIFGGAALAYFLGGIAYSLIKTLNDPIVLDLDGDGIELSSLQSSSIHFDFAGDGFAEQTGWVSADDGILAIDDNQNGIIDNGLEVFGSATQDGFSVLEKLDSNGDGAIDAYDADFSKLVIWQDANQNGQTDVGELRSLGEAGIRSISLDRGQLVGTNQGHGLGFQVEFIAMNNTTGAAQTIYFQTDNQHSIQDSTPQFIVGEGVDKLPQLLGSGLIASISYKATLDGDFKDAWAYLTDTAASMNPTVLKVAFEALLYRWADVDQIEIGSRGPHVNGQHLAFIERFFGENYRELQRGQEIRSYPSTVALGNDVEAMYQTVVSALQLTFLAQVVPSIIMRAGSAEIAMSNPYLFYALLDLSDHEPDEDLPDTPGNVGTVVDAIVAFSLETSGDAAVYLVKALSGLEGMIPSVFSGNRVEYENAIAPHLEALDDAILKTIAIQIVSGTAGLGHPVAEGINGDSSDNVIIGGGGGDLVSGDTGSDIYVYGKQDGDLWVKESSSTVVDVDLLLLTDLSSSDVTFERIGEDLLIRITSTGKTIVSEDFFREFTTQNFGLDVIRFADGTEWDRTQIKDASLFKGDGHNNLIQDSSLDDVIYGGGGDDLIQISQGNDTILYAKGDGCDVIQDRDLGNSGREVFQLTDLNASDIELSRIGSDGLKLTVKATGEYVQFDQFFTRVGSEWPTYKGNIDEIRFANGEVWDRAKIQENAWYRGTDRSESISGGDLNDTIEGGKGNDLLDGWTGSDTYVWRKGDGNDQITDVISLPGDVDTLNMADVTSGEVVFSYQGDTLLITVTSTGEVIRVLNFFMGVSNLTDDAFASQNGIDVIKFANGEILDRQQIYTLTGQEFLGRDQEVHSYYIDVEGVRTLVWMYFIDEFGHSGNFWGHMAPGQDDVYDQEIYRVADWNFNIGEANNVMNGGEGTNILAGGGGKDVLFGGVGTGHDVLYGDRGGDASFGDSDILDGGDGADALYGGGGSDALNGGSGNDYLSGDDGADILDGNAGDDIYVGGKGDDFLVASGSVTGSSGNDTYNYFLGDGNDVISESSDNSKQETDTLSLADLDVGDIELARIGDDLDIRIKTTGEIIRVVSQFAITLDSTTPGQGIEVIRFADGIEWNRDAIQQNAWYRGSDGRDVIVTGGNAVDGDGKALSDTLEGGKGDDVFYTGYQGSSGNDTFIYSQGDGNDVIYEQTWRSTFGTTHNETDTLKFTDINSSDVQLTRSGKDLLVKIISTNETITVVDQFAADVTAPAEGLELIRFANGEVWGRDRIQQEAWFRGTDGRDLIDVQAASWNDIIEGGKGDDIIITGDMGASGSDTYIYAAGDGNDVITDKTWAHFGPNEIDLLKLTDIDASDVQLSRSGDDLLVKIVSTNETITIVDQFAESSDAPGQGLEYIQFANGERWGRDTIAGIIASQVPFIAGTNHNDTLIGTAAAQNIYGETGNDIIDGRGGSDLLYGGVGDDTLEIGVSLPGDLVTVQGGPGIDTLDVSEFDSAIWLDFVTSGAELRTRDESDLSSGTWRDMAQVETVENAIGTAFSDQIYGDGGNNVLQGNAGDDTLDGRSGNDQLVGGDGSDTLAGGMGNDYLDGGDGSDVLNGGLDQDILIGGKGSDTLTGGTESDIFVFDADFGTDVITDFTAAGAGADLIRFDRSLFSDFASVVAAATQVGSDVVIEVAGSTLTLQNVALSSLTDQNFDFHRLNNHAPSSIVVDGGVVAENSAVGTLVATLSASDSDIGDAHTFSLVGGSDLFEIIDNEIRVKVGAHFDFEAASQQTLSVRATDDEGQSITSQILISITDTDDVQNGTGGDDIINGGIGIDVISGGTARDQLNGFAGSDVYLYNLGDGEDRVVEQGNAADTDKIKLGTGIAVEDVVVGRSSLSNHDVVIRFADGQLITLQDQLSGEPGSGVEEIWFSDNTIWTRADILAHLDASLIIGMSQNDALSGSASADIFDTSGGDDILRGNGSSDTYRFAGDFGHDRIIEGNDTGTDRVQFVDLNAADVQLSRSGDDLIISVTSTGNSVTVIDQFAWTNSGIEEIIFADGLIWGKSQIQSVAYTLGTSGNDVITGSDDDDVFRGGLGNDTLNGGVGSDTYVYFSGDGNDIINDATDSLPSIDVLRFGDLNESDLLFSRQGDNLVIAIVGTGEIITVANQLNASSNGAGLEEVHFANGTIWNRAQIQEHAWIRGTSGVDDLSGSSDADTFDGGAGNDTLRGQGGGDTYLYGAGSGNDTVIDTANYSGTDTVKLVGLSSADVKFTRSGNDLFIQILSSGETLKVQNQFDSTNGIEQVMFADDTIWDRSQILAASWIRGTSGNNDLSGSSDADTFDGGAGNDTLRGQGGGDTYLYGVGSGNDTVIDTASYSGTDTIKLIGLSSADVMFTRSGNDLFIQILSSGETLKVQSQFDSTNGIEQVVFADNTVWDRAQILAASWIRGTSGNDDLSGSNDADTFDGKGGNDTLRGNGDGDTYLYGVSSGNDTVIDTASYSGTDTIKLIGLSSADVMFTRSGNDLLIQILSSGETLRVSNQFDSTNGIEQVVFADDTIWDRSQIMVASWIRGTGGSDDLTGSNDADTFDGKGGNDTLRGNGGSDTYLYGAGSGNDTVIDTSNYSGTDTVKLVGLLSADVMFSRSGNDLLIQILSSGETLKVQSQFDGTNGIEQVVFGDNTLWDRSQILTAAWMRGTDSADNLIGSSDPDTFDGKGGDDTLQGNAGGDTYLYRVGSSNDIVIDTGNFSGTDTVKLIGLLSTDVMFTRSGNHLLIQILSSGETLKVQNQFDSTNGIEQVVFADNTAWDRNQILTASWIRGTSGSDTLSGSSDADTLDGKGGDDTLQGNGSGDTYVYGLGSGNDTVIDTGNFSGTDTVKLIGLLSTDVMFTRSGNHLLIQILSSGETLKVQGQFDSTNGIEQVVFADNTVWDRGQILASSWIRGTSGNDRLSGNSSSDIFFGSLGDDRFSSGAGSDTYIYRLGDGNDYIDDESGSITDIDVLRLTDLNATDLTFSRVGVNVVATVNSNGQTIMFDEQFRSQTANWGLEKIEFANGSSWDLATINSSAWYRGMSGNDTISGSSWNDTIYGDSGNDTLSGSGGDDIFVFRASSGQDIITDFSVGHDVLQFRDGVFADSAAAFAAASASGSNTIVTIDASTQVLLQNVALANLHVDDFRVV